MDTRTSLASLKTARRVLKRFTLPIVVVVLILTAMNVIHFVNTGSEALDQDAIWQVIAGRLQGISDGNKAVEIIVWDLRLPRALLAVVVGAGLGITGCAMQTSVRNPLTDPYLLGVSSGASVGTTAVIISGILSGFRLWSTSIRALFGALGAALAVYLVAVVQDGLAPIRLVLAGVVLSSTFSAIASFLVLERPNLHTVQSVLYWLLGSVSDAQWDRLPLATGIIMIYLMLFPLDSGQLDALAWRLDVAAALGVPVSMLRQGLFLLLAVLVGVLVAVFGGIGLVGLVIPHLCHMVVGSLHHRLPPIAAAVGGLFLLRVDVLSRVIVAPAEVPLGMVTGLVGVPVSLIAMGRRNYGFEDSS